MKRIKSMVLLGMCMTVFAACKGKTDVNPVSEPEQGIKAAEEAASAEGSETSVQGTDIICEKREGTSAGTVAAPEDFPKEYDYGSGRISDWSREDMFKKMPKPEENETVLNTDPAGIQALYLWEEGNAPAVTRFTKDMDGYFDEWDLGALDVARAVRFIRRHADAYGIAPENIAVMGFSAGGIQAGEFLMHYDEMVNGTVLDAAYVPDELDSIPACAPTAAGWRITCGGWKNCFSPAAAP